MDSDDDDGKGSPLLPSSLQPFDERAPSIFQDNGDESSDDGYGDAVPPPPTRRDIYRKILSAAWPQATVVACQNAISLTDVAVLGRLGNDQLAGAAFANIVIAMTGIVLWQGFGDALIALTSQAIGAGNPKLAGVWLQTSVLVIMLASLPIGVVWYFTEDILSLAGEGGPGPQVTHFAGQFARWSLIWLLPDAGFSAFCQWLNGQQLVKPTILIHLIFVGVNFGANVVLVHGCFGWGGLGFIGSPIATSCTKILRGCALLFYVCKGASTVGVYLGGGRPGSAKSAAKILLTMMFVMAVAVAVLFFAGHSSIGRLFSTDSNVINLASKLSMILGVAYALLSLAFASFGTLQGQGRPHIAAASMFIGLWGVSVPMAYVFGFPLHGELVGIWWGLVVGYFSMTTVMIVFVVRSPWDKLSQEAKLRSEKSGAVESDETEADGDIDDRASVSSRLSHSLTPVF